MGSCCSVTALPDHRVPPSTPSRRTSRARKLVATDGASGRRSSLQSTSPRRVHASGSANGSRSALLGLDGRQGSVSTGAAISASSPQLLDKSMSTHNQQIIATSISDSGAQGASGISEPSPLTFRNLELHASLSSTVVIPVSLPAEEQFYHFSLQQSAICPAQADCAAAVEVSAASANGQHSPVEGRTKTHSTPRQSCHSSVVSAQHVNAMFGSAEMDLGLDGIGDDGDDLPAFQPLQMPTHLWPV